MRNALFQISGWLAAAGRKAKSPVAPAKVGTRPVWLRLWLALGYFGVAVNLTPAQLTPYVWLQQTNLAIAPAPPLQSPSPYLLVYDSTRRDTVLGPTEPPAPQVEWLWNGAAWLSETPPMPTNSAYATPAAGMVFDTARQVAVLNQPMPDNGYQASPFQTWEWNGSAWSLATTNCPPTTYDAAMAYDQKRQRTVLFGGSQWPELYGDYDWTYEYDGIQWFLVATNGPSARNGCSAAYDIKHGVTVLFGGNSTADNYAYLNDTWTWNGTNWSEVATNGPAPRAYHNMVYDSFRQRVLLFGGEDGCCGTNNYFGDVWEWDGAQWTPSMSDGSGPSGRFQAGMAFDTTLNQAVLFSGEQVLGGTQITTLMNDTWVLAQREVWVDNSYAGTETGDFGTPFTTLKNALAAVANNGLITLKPGLDNEHLTIAQAVFLQAPLGSVTIGK